MTNKQGVLIVNLGTPKEPTPVAVKKFLSKFLHDYRVVDLPRIIWCPILHGEIIFFDLDGGRLPSHGLQRQASPCA